MSSASSNTTRHRCQNPRGADNPVIMASQGGWTELFTNPQYRGRTIVLIVCWMFGYAGLIYGVGAFLAVYMVDHGGDAHFVFLTIAAAYAALFVAFQVNAWLGESVERRNVIALMATLFAMCWIVAWLVPTLTRHRSMLYRSAASAPGCSCSTSTTTRRWPIRRASARLRLHGPMASDISAPGRGVTLLGPLYQLGPNHLGWILWIVIPGSLCLRS